jgi:glycosyltransferase involved in cell wall biosynthesis
MKMTHSSASRFLVAIPAFNEEATIGEVVRCVRKSLGEFDLLVVNDGSRDATGEVLRSLNVVTATHLCNLGYGRAVQTAIEFALDCDYDALITLDADGQHHPEQVEGMVQEFLAGEWDVLIGSRFIETRDYSEVPLGRRVGMQLFSMLVRLVAGQCVHDTTSGLKVIRRRVFEPLTHWHFVDFHAEAIVYVVRLGYRVSEYPITIGERKYGQSMYSGLTYIEYPLKTSLMVLLGGLEAELARRRKRQ